jgi:allantoinase
MARNPNSSEFVLRNASIPDGDSTRLVDIVCRDGCIVDIVSGGQTASAERLVDVGGKLVVPGCIDPHVHMNDPGFTHRETFQTGTASAARGGLTLIIDMPCSTNPAVRTAEGIAWKREGVQNKAHVDYAFWGGITGEDVRENALSRMDEQAHVGACGFKVYLIPSAPTYPGVNHGEMLEVLRRAAQIGKPVGVHAEDASLSEFYVKRFQQQGRLDAVAWAEARGAIAEEVAIATSIRLAQEVGAHLHIVHLSSAAGARLVAEARGKGVSVTAETCPQYLLLNAAEHMPRFGSLAKISPPLRTPADNAELWKYLAEGVLDFVGTDHAPLAQHEKFGDADIWTAYPGFPGVETLVPLMVSEGLNKGRLSLSRFVEVLSSNAAKLYGVFPRKGHIALGADADFTVIDRDEEWTFSAANSLSMAKYSPFDGWKMRGRPVMTIIRGHVVYDHAKGGLLGMPGFGQFVASR